MVQCTRTCKWLLAIKVQNSWNEVHCLKGESTHIKLIAVCGFDVLVEFCFHFPLFRFAGLINENVQDY